MSAASVSVPAFRPVRLLFAAPGPGEPSAFHFVLPEEWQSGYGQIRITSGAGGPVPFRAESIGARLAGLSIQARREDYPLAVSLNAGSSGASSPAEDLQFAGAVLCCTRNIPLTTRAFTMPEMLRLAALPDFHRHQKKFRTDLPGQLPEQPGMQKLLKVRRRHCRLISWHARFFLEKDMVLQAGPRSSTSAWLMLLDGQPVNGWQEESPVLTVSLKAGAHTLQYFVFLNTGERIPVPELSFPDDAGRSFSRVLIPWNSEMEFQLQTGGKNAGKVSLTVRDPVFWTASGKYSHLWRLQITGKDRTEEETVFYCNDRNTDSVRLSLQNGSLTWRMPAFRMPPAPVEGRLYWKLSHDSSQVFFQNEPITAGIFMELPEQHRKSLMSGLKLSVSALDRRGELLASFEPDISRQPAVVFTGRLPDQTCFLELTGFFRNQKVLDGGRIRIIRAEDSLDRLELRGNSVRLDGDKVLFVCPAPDRNARTEEKDAVRSAPGPRHVYLFQDGYGLRNQFIFPKSGPAGHYIFSSADRLHLSGSAPEMQEWLSCVRMVQMKPHTGILNMVFTPVRSDRDFPAYFRKICFLVRYLSLRGIRPVLVCPPPFPWEDQRLIYQKALLTKEFAWNYHLDVLDFYSAVRKKGILEKPVFAECSGIGYLRLSESYQKIFSDSIRLFFAGE